MDGLIVTGMPRSGTKTIASLLGLDHEKSLFVGNITLPVMKAAREASWMVAPYCTSYSGPVLHLVRDPLKVIASLIAKEFWNGSGQSLSAQRCSNEARKARREGVEEFDCEMTEARVEFVLDRLPHLDRSWPLPTLCAAWYVGWNDFLKCRPRVRIEDFQNAPIENSWPTAEQVSWSDIEDPWRSRLLLMAQEYGYLKA